MEWYQERKWTRDRVLRALQRYGMQFTGQRFTIAGWRQMAIGIANKYLNKVFGSGGLDGEDGDEEDWSGLVDSIVDLQAGHGSHVAGLIYARLFGQGDMGTMRSRDQFQQVSMQWHRFFGMGADDRLGKVKKEGEGVKREMDGYDWEREHLQRQRFGRLHRTDIAGQLKQMMGPEVSFRGMQERVIRSVMQGVWPIVQVTPTGGGKSLTFMLPAYCVPDGVTVVITPLVALENDMVQRCGRLGIDAYIWKREGTQRAASIVFVTPESAVTKGFGEFVERMHGQQKMDRAVVDECHTLLEWSKTFRPQIGALGRTLQGFGVPVICLTATLKPTEEARLFSALGFDRKRVQMFRERTTRTNIAYRVEVIKEVDVEAEGSGVGGRRSVTRKNRKKKVGEEEEEGEDIIDERIQEIVQAWTEEHAEGKVIVYGGTIKRVQGLAGRLGCQGYWNKAGTAEAKGKMMEDWVGSRIGRERVIVATNALGLGVDVPDVRLVVHAAMPRELRNFVQESGRGGRDGGRSTSVVVIRERWLQWQLKEREKGVAAGQRQQGWDADVVEFVEGGRCRREVLDREMDGITERIGCEGGEPGCDVCQRQRLQEDVSQLVEEVECIGEREEEEARAEMDYQGSQRRIHQAQVQARSKVMEEVGEAAGFAQLVEAWAGCCIACKADSKEETEHELSSCPRKGEETWQYVKHGLPSVEREMFEKRRFEAYSACFECGMPQSMCARWRVDDEDGRRFKAWGRRCPYEGVLVGMFVGMMVRFGDAAAEMIESMMRADGLKMEEESRLEASVLYPWLGGLVEWGGMQASRMCVVVYIMSQMKVE